MWNFLLRRLGGVLIVLVLASFLAFGLQMLSPGSVLSTLLGGQDASPERIAALTERYHLDDPFFVQYWNWLIDALHGDLGRSLISGESVTAMIGGRAVITLQLAAFAMVLVLAFGIPAGLAAGIARGGAVDRSVSAMTVIGMSAPPFAVGALLIYTFGVQLGWFPVYGAGAMNFADRISHLFLPAVSLAVALSAVVVRQTRAAVIHVIDQDFVTFARARGLGTGRLMVQYVIRNTAIPVITASGLLLITAVSAAVLVETVFSVQGVGLLMVQSIQAKDIPVVQGLCIFIALIVALVTLLVDAAAMLLDPRTRHGGAR